MKRSSTLKRFARRILSGALSAAVMLSGLLFAAQPASAAGAANTHYEFVATADADANFAELNPNLTVGAKAGSYSVVRSNQNATFFTQDGSLYSLRLFQLYNWVGTRGPNDKGNIVAMTNTEKVNDPDYHFGLAQYRTYCSDSDKGGLYTDTSRATIYYKAPTVNLEMVPQSFRPLDTANIGAANLSLVIASPMSAGNTMNVAFDRRLQVKVSLDGTTWLPGKAEIRSAEFLGGGKLGSTDYQLFRFETGDLLSIDGVKGNTIRAIKVLPEGSSDCSRSSFYINRMQVNTYATADDFNTLCPEEVIPTTTYSSGDELRKIVLAEALRTVKTRWSTAEDIVTVSPMGSSAVDSNYVKKSFLAKGDYLKYEYLAPVYDRETDASREQFWSQFDNYSTENHSITVTLPQTGSTTITVAAPKDAKYTAEDLCFQKTYQNKDADGNVTETLYSKSPYGMDCQTFVFNSISRVSRTSAVGAAGTLGATRTRIVQPADSSGMGNLKMLSHPLYTDWDIAHQNAAQKMYESYAAAQPGDIAVHNLSNHVCNVHTRLVRSVSVVRNSDGTINPTSSKMYFLEEAGGAPQEISVNYIGLTRTYSTARDNNGVTFENLAKVGSSGGSYVVYTLDEYKDGVVENPKVQAVAGSKQPNATFWNGGLNLSLNSNYRIIGYQVKLVNASGTALFDTGLTYPVNACAVGINYTSDEMDAYLRNLPNGSYKIVWEAHSGPLSNYTDTDVPVHTEEIEFTVTGRNNNEVCGSHSGWIGLDGAATLESGNYRLTQNVSGAITVPSGVTAKLCLNGYSIAAPADASAITVEGKLTLCNCSDTVAYITGASSASLININGGTLDMNNGIVLTNKSTAAQGGGVYMGSGTFNMNGGAIIDSVAGAGGGVFVNGGVFNLSGGMLAGNTTSAAANGTAIYAKSGTVNITENGYIKGDRNTVYGLTGSIYNISGGFVNGKLLPGGSGAKFIVSDQAVVYGDANSYGVVEVNGGTIYGDIISYKNVTVNGGTVYGNITAAIKKTSEKYTDETDGTEKSYIKSVDVGRVSINGGSICGTVVEESEVIEVGKPGQAGTATNTYTCEMTVTGGKFGVLMSRDALMDLIPEDITAICSVRDCNDPSGELAYEVVEGLYSDAEEKFMDFRSSLDFGVILHADYNFVPSDFVSADSSYAASAVGQYGTSYDVSFDVDTVPGMLILWAHGIAAKEMQDSITFKVTKADGTVLFEEDWSVYEVASIWHGDEDTGDQTMLADMIAYGNEARKAFNYHYTAGTNLPALDGGTEADPVWVATYGAGVTNDQQKNVAVTLSLRERIELNIYINNAAAEISNVKFAGMHYDAANYSTDTSSGSYTRVTFDNIPVVKAKGVLSFTVTMNDGTSFDMKYSMVDYARLATQNANNDQRDLIVALQKYVDSVYRYFGVVADWVEPDYSDDEIGAVGLPTLKSK